MPKVLIYLGLVAICLALLPPALIARARTVKTNTRRIHYIQDMDNQSKLRAQHANEAFADGRAMRPAIPGTVHRTGEPDDRHFQEGVVTGPNGDGWATTLPRQIPLDMDLLLRGQDRFGIYCTPCHGQSGYGDGIIDMRATQLRDNPLIGNGTVWVQPKSVHEALIREQPVGQLFNTATHGIRTMSGYESQVPVADRWAIVAFVKALQRSQNAKRGDVTDDVRATLNVIDLVPKGAE